MHPFCLLCLLSFGALLEAAELPAIPASNRVLDTEEVKNYWLNSLRKKPLPPKGTGLHPEKQRAREAEIHRRKTVISKIRNGDHDVDARLATLAHNIDAWNQLGQREEAERSEKELRSLREHLAKIATLEAQRELAVKSSLAIDRIRALEAEIASLEQDIANAAASSNSCNGCGQCGHCS